MPGRIRNTKTRSQRIELDYFKKAGRIPRWRRWITYILSGVGLLWVGFYALGNQAIYNAGTLAPVHQAVNGNCSACHVTHEPLSRRVTDRGCKSCHDGPPHHEASHEAEPSCASCHLDHRGAIKLAHVSDASCTQCHEDLLTHNPQTKVAKKVTRFEKGHHPDSAASQDISRDPATITFHHAKHLERAILLRAAGPGADAASNETVTMECTDCHRTVSVDQSWPYAASVSAKESPRNRHSNQAYMPPVTYEKHCQHCHPLQFDRVVEGLAPHHKTPQEVHNFVVEQFTVYAAAYPHALPPLTQRERQLPRYPLPPAPRDANEWIQQRVDNAERWLWGKQEDWLLGKQKKGGCNLCHALKFAAASSIPEIVPPKSRTRWFSHAVFDHQPHQMVTCITCHVGARTSERPAVLMPRIETCRECHSARSAQPAQTGCFECHVYHDWTREKPVNGRYALHGPRSAARLVTATEH